MRSWSNAQNPDRLGDVRQTVYAKDDPTFIISYKERAGWYSDRLGYSEGVGPFFSLPEALRRAEKQIGEQAWLPSRLTWLRLRPDPPKVNSSR